MGRSSQPHADLHGEYAHARFLSLYAKSSFGISLLLPNANRPPKRSSQPSKGWMMLVMVKKAPVQTAGGFSL
jgi:hypothetical protein